MERKAKIKRKTKETYIELEFNLEGSGFADIKTPFPFFNHVLESFVTHGNFDLVLSATGDVEVGCHHLVEDIGICLGSAISKCLEDKSGIERFGFVILPMDEAEVCLSLDISGRAYLRYNVIMDYELIEGIETSIVEDFFRALVDNCSITLHINKNVGINSHHIIEAIFKAFGIVLRIATRRTGASDVPSTKGVL
ncbi:MAG: imidazoleglycerol-phosphate dehydratase HisB [Actinobacteria bacterium]|nr:imidazoleglycerol-phosphate dehydratase HisB [Actinomycetota bacterium]